MLVAERLRPDTHSGDRNETYNCGNSQPATECVALAPIISSLDVTRLEGVAADHCLEGRAAAESRPA